LIHLFITAIVFAALVAWISLLLLPWMPWRTREVFEHLPEALQCLEPSPAQNLPVNLSDITVVIPARNEAAVIPSTLSALAMQGPGLRVLVVDDCSTDDTVDSIQQIQGLDITTVAGEPLPSGWAGKVWALDQGWRHVITPYTLFLDADIHLKPGVIAGLLQVSQARSRPFVSVMAALPMGTFWEKLLTPAFIYFFKMLYPFSLANGPERRFASAAGGCILLETALIAKIGGMQTIRDKLIDDCALAKRVKTAGFRTWTGQSNYVFSVRGYPRLSDIWNMVARSAYTQLLNSPLILLLTTVVLFMLFFGPPLGLVSSDATLRLAGLSAWLAMGTSYLPTLRFYRRSLLWILLMPLAGLLYLLMTWTSALRYYGGVRSAWKDRQYGR
jgi:hopene-associated glycosyltransferase HpnB